MKSCVYQKIVGYSPLIKSVASKFALTYAWTSFEYEDFIQECNIILLENIDKLDSISIKKLLNYRLTDFIRKHYGRKGSHKNNGRGNTSVLFEETTVQNEDAFLEAETKYFISLIPDNRLRKILDLLVLHGFNKKDVGELLGLSQGRIVQLTKQFGKDMSETP